MSLKEIKTAVFSLKEEKAPGVDGIPIEVYKTFWPYLKETLLEIYNETLELGTLTKTQKTSAVSVLNKGEKDPKSETIDQLAYSALTTKS